MKNLGNGHYEFIHNNKTYHIFKHYFTNIYKTYMVWCVDNEFNSFDTRKEAVKHIKDIKP